MNNLDALTSSLRCDLDSDKCVWEQTLRSCTAEIQKKVKEQAMLLNKKIKMFYKDLLDQLVKYCESDHNARACCPVPKLGYKVEIDFTRLINEIESMDVQFSEISPPSSFDNMDKTNAIVWSSMDKNGIFWVEQHLNADRWMFLTKIDRHIKFALIEKQLSLRDQITEQTTETTDTVDPPDKNEQNIDLTPVNNDSTLLDEKVTSSCDGSQPHHIDEAKTDVQHSESIDNLVQVGNVVLAHLALDISWHRAQVEAISDDKVSVRLLDHGILEVVTRDSIIEYDGSIYMDMPFMARCCQLKQTAEVSDQSDVGEVMQRNADIPYEARWFFNDEVLGKCITCEFHGKTSSNPEIWEVSLFTEQESAGGAMGDVALGHNINNLFFKKIDSLGKKDSILCRDIRFMGNDPSRKVLDVIGVVGGADKVDKNPDESLLAAVADDKIDNGATADAIILNKVEETIHELVEIEKDVEDKNDVEVTEENSETDKSLGANNFQACNLEKAEKVRVRSYTTGDRHEHYSKYEHIGTNSRHWSHHKDRRCQHNQAWNYYSHKSTENMQHQYLDKKKEHFQYKNQQQSKYSHPSQQIQQHDKSQHSHQMFQQNPQLLQLKGAQCTQQDQQQSSIHFQPLGTLRMPTQSSQPCQSSHKALFEKYLQQQESPRNILQQPQHIFGPNQYNLQHQFNPQSHESNQSANLLQPQLQQQNDYNSEQFQLILRQVLRNFFFIINQPKDSSLPQNTNQSAQEDPAVSSFMLHAASIDGKFDQQGSQQVQQFGFHQSAIHPVASEVNPTYKLLENQHFQSLEQFLTPKLVEQQINASEQHQITETSHFSRQDRMLQSPHKLPTSQNYVDPSQQVIQLQNEDICYPKEFSCPQDVPFQHCMQEAANDVPNVAHLQFLHENPHIECSAMPQDFTSAFQGDESQACGTTCGTTAPMATMHESDSSSLPQHHVDAEISHCSMDNELAAEASGSQMHGQCDSFGQICASSENLLPEEIKHDESNISEIEATGDITGIESGSKSSPEDKNKSPRNGAAFHNRNRYSNHGRYNNRNNDNRFKNTGRKCSLRCFKCNEIGHIAVQCPLNKSENKNISEHQQP